MLLLLLPGCSDSALVETCHVALPPLQCAPCCVAPLAHCAAESSAWGTACQEESACPYRAGDGAVAAAGADLRQRSCDVAAFEGNSNAESSNETAAAAAVVPLVLLAVHRADKKEVCFSLEYSVLEDLWPPCCTVVPSSPSFLLSPFSATFVFLIPHFHLAYRHKASKTKRHPQFVNPFDFVLIVFDCRRRPAMSAPTAVQS